MTCERSELKRARDDFIHPFFNDERGENSPPSLQELFIKARQDEHSATLALSEIIRSYSRLLPSVEDETIRDMFYKEPLNAVCLAENNYKEELAVGKKAFLAALKAMNGAFTACKTVAQAMKKKTSLAKIERLEIKNSQNKRMRLPAEIGACTGLKFLACYNAHLTELPKEIANCTLLERINLLNNDLAKGEAEKLKRLFPKAALFY